jgi:hypothetical protein
MRMISKVTTEVLHWISDLFSCCVSSIRCRYEKVVKHGEPACRKLLSLSRSSIRKQMRPATRDIYLATEHSSHHSSRTCL